MAQLSAAEQFLLDGIRAGDQDAWGQLVSRYEGRLRAFASSKVRQMADAEDLVQETFISFIGGLENYRAQASIETFLFTILRRKIIDVYRGRGVEKYCLIQDVYSRSGDDDSRATGFDNIASEEISASRYVSREEQLVIEHEKLGGALVEMISSFKDESKFTELKIVELLFYARMRNREISKVLDVTTEKISLLKHRCIKGLKDTLISRGANLNIEAVALENLLTGAWESQRLSCPKRSTIGSWHLGTLSVQWGRFVDFHINTLGCHYCIASHEDLQHQASEKASSIFKERILESTVGFLLKK